MHTDEEEVGDKDRPASTSRSHIDPAPPNDSDLQDYRILGGAASNLQLYHVYPTCIEYLTPYSAARPQLHLDITHGRWKRSSLATTRRIFSTYGP